MSESAVNEAEVFDGRYLLFNVGSSLYGLPLSSIIEIVDIQRITPVPNTADYVVGVINLRGKIVPVINMRLKLNLEEIPYDDKTNIVVADYDDMKIGLIVDQVSEVVTIAEDSFSAPPSAGKKTSQFLDSVCDLGNSRVALNLSLSKFFANDLEIK